MTVKCTYCGGKAELVDGVVIYPDSPHLAEKRFWLCRRCDAYVGCHQGTTSPLGTLANLELRMARRRLHGLFDPMWRDGFMTRSEAYRRLGSVLGLTKRQCHIGMFDLDTTYTAIVEVRKMRFKDA